MIQLLTEKSRDCMRFNGFFLCLEGAVRSTKTVTANNYFYKRILFSRDSTFLMLGNTQGSLVRNVIDGDFGLLAITGHAARIKQDQHSIKYISLPAPTGDPRGEIKIYYFGGDTIASFKKIRGLTVGGVYYDEYNLLHRETIETAEGRSIAALDRFQVATLNPDVPGLWIYKERIDKYLGMPGYKYQHFTIDDNPAIPAERKEELKLQYTGVFYDRYILGKRVRAEGMCYPSFTEKNIIDKVPDGVRFVVVGADVGGNKSASALAATGFFVKDGKLCAVLVDEFYDADNKSAESYISNYVEFAKKVKRSFKCIDCYFESGEQLLKNSCENTGVLNIYNSVKLPIIDRIRFFDLMFSQGRLFIMKDCTYTIDAVRSAVYDPKSQNEERLDNGTTNIDSLDAWEYSITPHFSDF